MTNLIQKIVGEKRGLIATGTIFGLSAGILTADVLENYVSPPHNNVSFAYLDSTKQNLTLVLENRGEKVTKVTMVPSEYGFDIAHLKRIKGKGYQIYQPKLDTSNAVKEAKK